MRRLATLAPIVCLALSGSGCAWTEGGVRRTLVIGFGVIETVPVSTEQTESAVAVSNTKMLGVFLGGAPGVNGLVAGYMRSQSVGVSVDAEALVEAVSCENGTLQVCVRPIVVRADGSSVEPDEGDGP